MLSIYRHSTLKIAFVCDVLDFLQKEGKQFSTPTTFLKRIKHRFKEQRPKSSLLSLDRLPGI